jgi:hypothetical protein
MRKNIYKYGICMLSLLSLVACKNENELAYSTSPLSTQLYQGQSTDVAVKSFGVKSSQGYDVEGVTWSSADEFIATVDANGKATAQHVGNVRIYGEFDGGKTVYCDLDVVGRYNIYNEPITNIDSIGAAVQYESGMKKVLVRGGKSGDDYAVFMDTAANVAPFVDYTIYLVGNVKGEMVSMKSADTYSAVEKNFLPERYFVKDGFFNNPYDVRVVLNSAAMKTMAYYMSDKAPVAVDKMVAAYKATALKDLNRLSSADSYSKKALDLANDFSYETIDKAALTSLVTEGTATINAATGVAEVENTLVEKAGQFEVLYVAAGRNSAKEICYKRLPKGHEQAEYYDASWNKINELDAGLDAALAATKTIKELDKATSDYSVQYADILTKVNADLYIQNVEKQFANYKESDYTPEVWAMLVADKDKAVNDATGIKAQSSALEANRMRQTAVDSFKDYMKAADAPKEIEKSKKALEDSFAKSYKESDYTPENWQVLLTIKAEALNAMDKAVKKSELTQIAADAEKAFKAVEKAEK